MAMKKPAGEYPFAQGPHRVRLSPAPCAVDLGDGSERGEYVNQDYILGLLGRPHRSINLMYCYYPLDKGWPKRASEAFPRTADFAWAYPYDDYFPYGGGPKGSAKNDPFPQIRDARRHGQDVTLTLTMDCKVPDSHLRWIARELRPFGRLRVRINHECDGEWFAFNKRYDRRTISGFFARFNGILKEHAPEIRTICCFGSVEWNTGKISHLDDLALQLDHADIWSIDKYLALHWTWPYDICERYRQGGWKHEGVDLVWKEMHRVYEAFVERVGVEKPLEICEFNLDGDVVGPRAQAEELAEFYDRVRRKRPPFLKGITYYQFRDRGRLGLEAHDPNDPKVGVPQPFLARYRELIRDPYFSPGETWTRLPRGARLATEWRGADDSDGLGWKVRVKPHPEFFELKLPKDLNLLIRVAGTWLYKKPGYEWVDATAAVEGLRRPQAVSVAVFAPPADGSNGGRAAVRTVLREPPRLRLR